MLVSQIGPIGRKVCWSVKTAGVGREVCWSVTTAGVGGEVCLSCKQLG